MWQGTLAMAYMTLLHCCSVMLSSAVCGRMHHSVLLHAVHFEMACPFC